MTEKEIKHAALFAMVRRLEQAMAHTIRQMEAGFHQEPPEVFDALEETTYALRGKIRILVQGMRSLLKALLLAKRHPREDRLQALVEKETQTAIELFALLNESLD